MAFMNAVLVTITMLNIKTERQEKILVEEEKKRQAELARQEAEGGANLKGVLTEDDEESEQEEKVAELTWQ